MRRATTICLGSGIAVLGGGYLLVVRGALTIDTGVGRCRRPLGPFTLEIAAPAETVFDVIAAPYLQRTPRAMAAKLEVLERGTDLVLAAHHTRAAKWLTATTLETVRFEPPHRIWFRLVRGPVPEVTEKFELQPRVGGTAFVYTGEMGTDGWAAGRWWGDRVARSWEKAVLGSLASIKAEAERRSALRTR